MKKILSTVLAALLIVTGLSALGFSVSADEARTISTADELIAFANEANEAGKSFMAGQTIKVTADIDMSGKTYTPIKEGVFILNFDGHTVSNLNVTVENSNQAGLIANKLSNGGGNGGITNITLKNCTLTVKVADGGSCSVGGVVGYADRGYVDGANLENVTIKTDGAGSVGGVIGKKEWAGGSTNMSGTMKNVEIDAPKATVGIIVGSIGGDASVSLSNIDAVLTVRNSTNAIKNDTYVAAGVTDTNVTVGDNVKAAVTSYSEANELETIDTPEELVKFANKANEIGKSYREKETIKVTADLDMAGLTYTPIKEGLFILDFQGHTVSNLVVAVDNAEGNVGLIANEMTNNNFNGGITNIKLKNCSLTVNAAEGKEVIVGGIVGTANRAYVETASLENVTIKVTGTGFVGGVIGSRSWAGGPKEMTVTMKDVVIDAADAKVGIVIGRTFDDAEVELKAVDAALTVKASANEVKADTYIGEIANAEKVTVGATGVKAELVDNAVGYVALTKPDTPDTPDTPVTPDKPTNPPQTGDAMVIAVVAAVLALAGAAVITKKRASSK